MTRPVITLTTDFGHGPFVGVMKGVVLGICREAALVDICHTIAPQDVRAGALAVEQAMTAFPPGTVHLCVVDPGVGSSRRAMAVRAMDMFFVGPDNGLLSAPLLADAKAEAWALENQAFFRRPVSATFHGRDIFAPCAARLACGLAPEELGPMISDPVLLAWPKARRTAEVISGEVIGVDSFGNLASNIPAEMLHGFLAGQPGEVTLHLPGQTITIGQISHTYGAAERGRYVAVVSSDGRLELSLNGGSLAGRISALSSDPRGLRVTVKHRQD